MRNPLPDAGLWHMVLVAGFVLLLTFGVFNSFNVSSTAVDSYEESRRNYAAGPGTTDQPPTYNPQAGIGGAPPAYLTPDPCIK